MTVRYSAGFSVLQSTKNPVEFTFEACELVHCLRCSHRVMLLQSVSHHSLYRSLPQDNKLYRRLQKCLLNPCNVVAPDHHCTQVTGTQERHLRDDGIVGTLCHFQGQLHHYHEHCRSDRCNLLGVRVPKKTRWRPQKIHSETYCQVRGRMDTLQLQNAKAVMTPLTEQKSLNLHDETTICDQVQHSLFRAVVGKLQYFTGVRPDLMFATKCLSYKLSSPTLADLTRAKKVLSNLKGTRELNLYPTIPALKPNDLNKTLNHITGYSDADWASDPVTWKSTSCTLCYVDQFLLRSECRGQVTVALSSRESELHALGALSTELIFAQAILKEIGLSFLIHARADSSTVRAVATKQGASRKMKHIHTRFLFIQDSVFRKL